MQIRYVLGFMFSESRLMGALIRKAKPAWQAGKLNGVGGKVEPEDKGGHEAMRREFREETGVDHEEWDLFLRLYGEGFEIEVFRAFTDKVNQVKTTTVEEVKLMPVAILRDLLVKAPDLFLTNIQWILPLALDEGDRSDCGKQHSTPKVGVVFY